MSSILLYGVFILFFLQLTTDFVHNLFAFGLLGTSIPPEIVCVLFLFLPLLCFSFRRRFPRWFIYTAGLTVLVTRLLEPDLSTRSRMLISGLGVGASLVFLPGYLWWQSRRPQGEVWGSAVAGGLLALALSVLFRSLNAGVDISTRGAFQVLGWAVGGVGAYALWREGQREPLEVKKGERVGWGRVIAASLGWMSVLVTLYFIFASPNVLARWTGVDYPLIVIGVCFSLAGFALLYSLLPAFRKLFTPRVIVGANLLFATALLLTILPHQLSFPDDPAAYPIYAPGPSLLGSLALVVLILLMPLLWIDLELFHHQLRSRKHPPRAYAAGFALGAIFLLLMIFSHVFTTVYDYVPVVGPLFRDAFWAVHAVLGLTLSVTAWLLVEDAGKALKVTPRNFRDWMPGLVLVALAASASVLWPSPVREPEDEAPSSLRVMTYNIQQGFSEDGVFNPDGQLDLIREWDPEVIGLQESGTNRISGGNNDLVRYYGEQLGMYTYYGPKVVTGTFGIALLSRYPMHNPQTFYMYSEGEQTAAINASLEVGGQTLQVFVTHLGNEGPMIQQKQFLSEVKGSEYMIALGDFNFQPSSEQYVMTTSHLRDAWEEGKSESTGKADKFPENRIDHVFLSEEFRVDRATYLRSPQSDHPALVVDVSW